MKRAFTFVELLVTIVVLTILTALLMPALSKAKQSAQGRLCLNNGRQLMFAMTMYASDFHDYFPPNPDDSNSPPGHDWCSGHAGVGEADEFNSDVLKDPNRSLLISYIGGNVTVFHCPGDKRIGRYTGKDPNLIRKTVPASRTFSMNQAVGTICPGFDSAPSDAPHYGPPTLPVNGPWLDNSNKHHRNTPWLTYGKFSSIISPGPSSLWILLDESTTEINDAAFAFGMKDPVWYDVPGTYHNRGCGLAFADAHSDAHHWRSSSEKKRGYIANLADREDWLWLRDRTSANVDGRNLGF